MQCCSQWGPTSRLWNVERSTIKTAERALRRAGELRYTCVQKTHRTQLVCTQDLCLSCVYWKTHKYLVKFTVRSLWAADTLEDEQDVTGHFTQKHFRACWSKNKTGNMEGCYLLLYNEFGGGSKKKEVLSLQSRHFKSKFTCQLQSITGPVFGFEINMKRKIEAKQRFAWRIWL